MAVTLLTPRHPRDPVPGLAGPGQAPARVGTPRRPLGGAASQQRGQRALAGLDVLWVAVKCASAVAAGRELARADPVTGMAGSQAELVHQGVVCDLEVDTTHTEALACASTIATHIG